MLTYVRIILRADIYCETGPRGTGNRPAARRIRTHDSTIKSRARYRLSQVGFLIMVLCTIFTPMRLAMANTAMPFRIRHVYAIYI